MARNTGELPIEIYGFKINGLSCEGYGFKVLNCASFKLNPNTTKKIEIAFTPDFTLSRVERKLFVLTSVGPNSGSEDMKNGVMILNLQATLPTHLLDLCASVLVRPSLERVMQWAAISISTILFLCVVIVSFIEADRILRSVLASYSKESTVQPPLDLRLLSHVHNTTQIGGNSGSGCGSGSSGSCSGGNGNNKNEKTISNDEKSKIRKDEAFPDWTLMNVKKCKDKDSQRGLKIPDWSAEEERKFKLDTESKDLLSFKRCDELSSVDNANAMSAVNTCGSKKKNTKKQNSTQEVISENYAMNDMLMDTQLNQEKKCIVNVTTKLSPTSNRKGKSMQSNIKEEPKLVDHEIQVDAGVINNSRTNKSDNKRNKQTSNSGNNSNHNNHVSLKKLESTSIQKIVHLSEEETSSTTTESSTHDETTLCKVSTSYINS